MELPFTSIYRDSLIVGVGNICTSIFAGFVIFSIVGYLAKEMDTPVGEVVKQGRTFVRPTETQK